MKVLGNIGTGWGTAQLRAVKEVRSGTGADEMKIVDKGRRESGNGEYGGW